VAEVATLSLLDQATLTGVAGTWIVWLVALKVTLNQTVSAA
jgi:hypothetical protein